MKMIEQYVYAVTRYLPEKSREDIGRELKANIEEMLSDTPTEAEVRGVLEELGNPQVLASEYYPHKNYLIGPVLFPEYLSILKLVVTIVVMTLASLTVISWGFNPAAGYDFVQLFIDLLWAVFNGAMHTAMWVTIVFAVMERIQVTANGIPFNDKTWSLDSLPELPEPPSKKFSRLELAFEALISIIILSVLYSFPQLIAIHQEGVGSIPLFEVNQLQSYLPIVVVFTGIQLALMGWKWVAGQWNYKLAMVNALFNIGYCLLSLVMIHDAQLFNPEFFMFFEELTTLSLPVASGISAVVIIISIFEIFSGFRHAYLNRKK